MGQIRFHISEQPSDVTRPGDLDGFFKVADREILFMGMNAIGDAGLRDQVNQHYASTFGASAAVGLISGFAQFLSAGTGSRTGSPVIITGNISDATAQATSQAMARFLNRLPRVTIREGHRVKVYLTSDLQLPVYQPSPVVSDTGLRIAERVQP